MNILYRIESTSLCVFIVLSSSFTLFLTSGWMISRKKLPEIKSQLYIKLNNIFETNSAGPFFILHEKQQQGYLPQSGCFLHLEDREQIQFYCCNNFSIFEEKIGNGYIPAKVRTSQDSRFTGPDASSLQVPYSLYQLFSVFRRSPFRLNCGWWSRAHKRMYCCGYC